MHVYVICQMDYSSPVFPEMDYPLWIFKKVFQVYLGLITFVRLLHVYVSCEIDYTHLYAYVSVYWITQPNWINICYDRE